MPTQGERQSFLWRPNTNDSTTLARYEQEAQHWVKAFKSANRPKATLSGSLNGLGVILNFVFALLSLIVSCISSILIWLFRNKNEKTKNGKFKQINQSDIYSNKIVDFNSNHKENQNSNLMVRKIESLISNRPRVFQGKRSKMFKNAAKYVVLKQNVSISNLMYELKIDFKKVCQLLDDLYEAGIISDPLKENQKRVLIKNLEILKLLFEMEKSYSV